MDVRRSDGGRYGFRRQDATVSLQALKLATGDYRRGRTLIVIDVCILID
jgi:hypothetical protein